MHLVIYTNQKEIDIKKKGKLTLKFESSDKKQIIEETVFDFDSPGVGISYFNIDSSIQDFAFSCFWCSPVEKYHFFIH